MKGSINSIETMGAVDGPGIRTVIFMQGCFLRCKYCQNPETWNIKKPNISVDELLKKVKRFKSYYGKNGGVTFSGGEPLIQYEFLIEASKKLKKNDINIAIDTAGCGLGWYEEILKNIDLIIFDVKDARKEKFYELTNKENTESLHFLKIARLLHKKFWIRQVVVPGLHDNEKYLYELKEYIIDNFELNDIEKIEFLPYHKMGDFKYTELAIKNPYENKIAMDEKKCEELYLQFKQIFNVK